MISKCCELVKLCHTSRRDPGLSDVMYEKHVLIFADCWMVCRRSDLCSVHSGIFWGYS